MKTPLLSQILGSIIDYIGNSAGKLVEQLMQNIGLLTKEEKE
jgi:hypothetical protein